MSDQSSPPTGWRQQWVTVIAMIIVIIAIVGLVDLRAVWNQLITSDPGYVLAASAALFLGLWVYAARWRLLLAGQTRQRPTFHAGNIGHMFNILTPIRAGEPARILALSQREPVTVPVVTSSVVVERLFEQMLRLVGLGGAVLYGVGLEVSPLSLGGGIAALVAAFGGIYLMLHFPEPVLEHGPPLLARLPRVTEGGAHNALKDLLANLGALAAPARLLQTILFSLTAWGLFGVFHYFILLALGLDLPQNEMLAISLGALAVSPPSAPALPGIYHASVIGPLVFVAGYDETVVTAFATLAHAVEIVWMVGLGLWGLNRLGLSFSGLLSRGGAAD